MKDERALHVAYADPPYVGRAYRYRLHKDYAGEVDHVALVERLVDEYPDGWALSSTSTSLAKLLVLCPPDVRVAAWVKPFAPYRQGINPAYAWEPVIFRGGRGWDPIRREHVRDWLLLGAQQRGRILGQKPVGFCYWVFNLLGLRLGDELDDLYPGSRAVSHAWEMYANQMRLPQPTSAEQLELCGIE